MEFDLFAGKRADRKRERYRILHVEDAHEIYIRNPLMTQNAGARLREILFCSIEVERGTNRDIEISSYP